MKPDWDTTTILVGGAIVIGMAAGTALGLFGFYLFLRMWGYV